MSIVALLLVAFAHAPVAEWVAPPECPGSDAVLAAAEHFGAPVADASLSLDGRIDAVEGGYRLDLEIRTPSGTTTRRLFAESCDELTRAAGLVLSVTVDPLRVPEAPIVEAPAASESPTALASTTESAPASDRSPVLAPSGTDSADVDRGDPPAVRGSIVGGGSLGRGLPPTLDGRAMLGLTLDTRWIRAELLGFHAFARTVRYPDRPDIGATIDAWGASARVGPRASVAALELACPVGIELAAVTGRGFGVTDTWRRSDLAWSVLVAPGLRVPLGNRISIGVDAALSVAVRRPAFTVDQRDPLYRIARIGARGGARLEVQFAGAPRDQFRTKRRPR